MNANDITFGVEIETTIPTGTLAVGGHGHGLPIPQLTGWKADGDPSIRAGAGRVACEFVSPVFRGAQGLRQLIADVQTIKSMGAEVNPSCGLHVHVGFDKSDAVASQRLATLVSNFERAIYASTGTKNRERGQWCAGLNRYGNANQALSSARNQRYHVANFATVKPTIEFRAFSSSLNPKKIVAYVRMCVGMVERALTAKRITNWTAKPVVQTSPIHRSGDGQTALTRLFYQLGWIKGRQSYAHGNLTGEGLSDLKTTRRTLMDLARKYDAQS